MYHSRRCLLNLQYCLPLTYVLFFEFLDSAVGHHRLYLMQRVEVRCRVPCALLVGPLDGCPRQHVAVIAQPSLSHHADVLRHLAVSQPAFLIALHRFSHRPLHCRHYLCLQLPVHTYAKRVIVRLRAIVPSMGSPMMALNCQP